MKRSRYKTGDGVTLPPPAPNLPAKPFSGPLGPGLTRRCRSAAERPPRCAAPSDAARSRPRAAPGLETGCARELAHGRASSQFLARPRHLGLQQLLSRDSRASTGPRLLHSREGRPGRPYTLQELSEVLSSRLWAGSGCGQALRGQEQVENVQEEIRIWESGTNNQSLSFQICKLGE